LPWKNIVVFYTQLLQISGVEKKLKVAFVDADVLSQIKS
jgi:hypothetical protein